MNSLWIKCWVSALVMGFATMAISVIFMSTLAGSIAHPLFKSFSLTFVIGTGCFFISILGLRHEVTKFEKGKMKKKGSRRVG